MSRKVINVVASKNQFKVLNFTPIFSKIQQITDPDSEVNEVDVTEQEGLEIYDVESLSEIHNENLVQVTISEEADGIPGLTMTSNFFSISSTIYQSLNIDLESPLTLYRVYNVFLFQQEQISFIFIVSILKDGVEETDDIKTRFLLQKV